MKLYIKKEEYIDITICEEEQIIHTSTGDVVAQIGNYIITDIDGVQDCISYDEYTELITDYELVEGTQYKSKPVLLATELPEEISLESGLLVPEGDFLVLRLDSNEMYHCDPQTLEEKYTLLLDKDSVDIEDDTVENFVEDESYDDTELDSSVDTAEDATLNPSIGTIVRSIALAIVSLVTILNGFGVITYADASTDEIYNFLISIITVIVAIRCWWKNNSFTEAAKKADKLMQELKDNESTTNG